MFEHIEDNQALAARKLAKSTLREIGVRCLTEYEPHKLEWRDLGKHEKILLRATGDLIDKIEAKTSEKDMADIEAASDALNAALNNISFEKDQRTEIGDRSAREHPGSAKRPGGGEMSVRANGEAIRTDALDEVETRALKPEQRMAQWVRDHTDAPEHEIRLGDYFRAMVVGAKTEAEKRTLAEGTDSQGGYTVPDILSAQLIDLMRARTVVMRAGARTVPLRSDVNHVAKLLTDPTPAWRAENAEITASDPTFGRITFEPKSLAVLVKVSRELLEDSLNLSTELPRIIAAAMAVELDRVSLFGSGVGNEPTGLVNTSGVGEVAHNAALTNYGPLITARTQVLTANAMGVSAYVMHPRDEGTFAGLADTTGQPLRKPSAIEDVPFLTTTSVPFGGSPADISSIVTGDFTKLLVGIRNDIRIEVLRERYGEFYQYGFLGVMRADIAVEQASAFSHVTGIHPTGGSEV